MLTCVQQLYDLEDLRAYVNETLCEYNQLQIDAFKMIERVLHRAGTPCGIYFCLYGPRGVRFTAIWETDRNCILFYGANGERFQKTQLLVAPRLEALNGCPMQTAAA